MQINLNRHRSILRLAVPTLGILLGMGTYRAVAQKKPDPSKIVDPYNTKARADSRVEESLSFNFFGGPDWRTVKLEIPIKASARENFLATPVNTLRSQGIHVPEAAEEPWREFTQALRRLVNGQRGRGANNASSAGRETLTFKIILTESGNQLFRLFGDVNSDGRTAEKFLINPSETLRSQGVQVLPADELDWKQIADSLKALKLAYAKPSKGDPDRPIILGQTPNAEAKTEGTIGSGSNVDPRAPANLKAKALQPDLLIKQFLFPPTNDKALRVHVVNTGKAPSVACRLVITVRKINGVAVGRTTHVNVPLLAAGADVWLHIDAKSILPNNVSLQSTTFRLNVDATEIVAESNEANNEVWHNQ